MVSNPFTDDFWQNRCQRLIEKLSESHPLREFCQALWRSYMERTQHVSIPTGDTSLSEIKILTWQFGPPTTKVFHDWRYGPDTFHLIHRLRAMHASLRCGLAETEAGKTVGTIQTNIMELNKEQIHQLCNTLAGEWDRDENIFLSPFSLLATILRNWLDGLYGEKPIGLHPSLDILKEVQVTSQDLLTQTAAGLCSLLCEKLGLPQSPWVGVVGEGRWAEAVTRVLTSLGAKCKQLDHLPTEAANEIIFLIHTENIINVEKAERLTCRILVELLPNQINPEADKILKENGISVVPDILCSCAEEIIEDWWLRGKPTPAWATYLTHAMVNLWKEVQERAAREQISTHDAAFMLAMEKLAERWN